MNNDNTEEREFHQLCLRYHDILTNGEERALPDGRRVYTTPCASTLREITDFLTKHGAMLEPSLPQAQEPSNPSNT